VTSKLHGSTSQKSVVPLNTANKTLSLSIQFRTCHPHQASAFNSVPVIPTKPQHSIPYLSSPPSVSIQFRTCHPHQASACYSVPVIPTKRQHSIPYMSSPPSVSIQFRTCHPHQASAFNSVHVIPTKRHKNFAHHNLLDLKIPTIFFGSDNYKYPPPVMYSTLFAFIGITNRA
jgi:predicted heme/steroid binding protein